jgi:type I restriction enzyme M protein
MPNGSAAIVQKLWNYCNILRDDAPSYGDYVEQLTYLLFLKMAHEQTQPPFSRAAIVPEDYNWSSLLDPEGDALEIHYRHVLENLKREKGLLGRLPQSPEQDPGPRETAPADR